MSATTTTVTEIAEPIATTLKLRSPEEEKTKEYRYAHLLPHFSQDHYPPLEPYEHVDPGRRALSLENPRAFLEGATSVDELTPSLGTEVTGINLATLDSTGRDQVALEVSSTYSFTGRHVHCKSGGPSRGCGLS